MRQNSGSSPFRRLNVVSPTANVGVGYAALPSAYPRMGWFSEPHMRMVRSSRGEMRSLPKTARRRGLRRDSSRNVHLDRWLRPMKWPEPSARFVGRHCDWSRFIHSVLTQSIVPPGGDTLDGWTRGDTDASRCTTLFRAVRRHGVTVFGRLGTEASLTLVGRITRCHPRKK